ncbi:hypothetical protein N0V90_002226 [Kalmusia sp. IMI 367209]|nr:hypothetical protein N0V90_002226 [Kalmusia sp. IMI 367209]
MPNILIYGATGYTGLLASTQAQALSLPIVVAGRSKLEVVALASTLQVPYRIFSAEAGSNLDSALQDVQVLLNCAGPFHHTARPLMEACIRNRVHYLDISAELISYHVAEELDESAREAGVMLLPGCGGSVAMLGCLVGHALEGFGTPLSIDVALDVAGPMSRGSAISAAESLATQCLQRFEGTLVSQDVSTTRAFNFGGGRASTECFPVTLPDLITLWKTTGVGNIRTYAHISTEAFPSQNLEDLPDGPTAEEREVNSYHAAVILTARDGIVKREVLHTMNGYTFTAIASVEIAKRVSAGQLKAGFQTPAYVFGPKFLDLIPSSKIRTL